MSGILDSKSRIIDAILTIEGREQMASGRLDIAYVTFTDADVAYNTNAAEGHEDPASKLYFEASNLPQDEITFRADDRGALVPFRSQDVKVANSTGNTSGSVQGVIRNGRLTVYQYHNGRTIRTDGLEQSDVDKDLGIIYTDASGTEGKVLIDPRQLAGTVTATAPGGPYVAFIGSRGGMGPQQFANAISSSIAELSSIGGPQVPVSCSDDTVYLDGPGFLAKDTQLRLTGTLSSPLIIQSAAIGGKLLSNEVENASFATQITGILTSSIDNFQQLQCLSTIDRLFEDDSFELSSQIVNFDLSAMTNKMSEIMRETPPSLNSLDSMFSDGRFSNLLKFRYLPPIVKTSDVVLPDKRKIAQLTPYLLGNYPSWGDNEEKMTHAKVYQHAESFGDIKQPIIARKTSINNRLVAQIFEVTDDVVTKLDLVRFGWNDNKLIYFAGKTFVDDRGTTVFVNLFTFVFQKYEKVDQFMSPEVPQ